MCDDVAALQASVQRLQDARVGENGLSTLAGELPQIRATLAQLRTDASAEYAPEVSAVRSRTDALTASIQAAVTAPSASSLGRVADDLKAMGAAVTDLGDAVSDSC